VTPEADAPPKLNVFLSYRRDDASAYALLLFHSLSARYGDKNVFMDIDSLVPGTDFVEAINETLERCDVLLALIGHAWLTATDDDGNRRLENPEDFVRLEVETALTRNIPVVPLLVEGTSMPKSNQLPGELLARLARRHAFELSHTRWDSDVTSLMKQLERAHEAPPAAADESSTQADQLRVLKGLYDDNAPKRTLNREDRSWERKAEVYVDLIGLMHRRAVVRGIYDAGYLVPGGPVSDAELAPLLAARLRTFGSAKVRELLRGFWKAEEEYDAAKKAANDKAMQVASDSVKKSISELEEQVRQELSA
jgi:hypothetical protein